MAGAFQADAFQAGAFQTDGVQPDEQTSVVGGSWPLPTHADRLRWLRDRRGPAPAAHPEPLTLVVGSGSVPLRRPKAAGRGVVGTSGFGVAAVRRKPRATGAGSFFDSVVADNAVIMLSF